MALHSLYCTDVPLRNCSLTHSLFLPQLSLAGMRMLLWHKLANWAILESVAMQPVLA